MANSSYKPDLVEKLNNVNDVIPYTRNYMLNYLKGQLDEFNQYGMVLYHYHYIQDYAKQLAGINNSLAKDWNAMYRDLQSASYLDPASVLYKASLEAGDDDLGLDWWEDFTKDFAATEIGNVEEAINTIEYLIEDWQPFLFGGKSFKAEESIFDDKHKKNIEALFNHWNQVIALGEVVSEYWDSQSLIQELDPSLADEIGETWNRLYDLAYDANKILNDMNALISSEQFKKHGWTTYAVQSVSGKIKSLNLSYKSGQLAGLLNVQKSYIKELSESALGELSQSELISAMAESVEVAEAQAGFAYEVASDALEEIRDIDKVQDYLQEEYDMSVWDDLRPYYEQLQEIINDLFDIEKFLSSLNIRNAGTYLGGL